MTKQMWLNFGLMLMGVVCPGTLLSSVAADDAAHDCVAELDGCGYDGCGYDGCGDAGGLFAHSGGGGWLSSMIGESDSETTLGSRVWIGPRWEERSGSDQDGPLGSFPIDGDVSGVSFGWRARNVDALFMSLEGVVVDGDFRTTIGQVTNYDESQFEALFGYTIADDCRTVFITPYTGMRYRNTENSVLSGSLLLDVEQEVWTAPFGIKADALLTDDFAAGIDARMQWKIDDEQVLQTGGQTVLSESGTNDISWRIDVPFTFRVCCSGEIELRPYYEWDRFNSNTSVRSRAIDEYGGQISFIWRY